MKNLKRSDVVITDTSVLMTVSYPLWTSIPEGKRVTEAMIRGKFAGWSEDYIERELARLHPPHCIVAVAAERIRGGLWIPCGRDIAPDASLCRFHGGPNKSVVPVSEVVQLRAEIAELRAELSAQSAS